MVALACASLAAGGVWAASPASAAVAVSSNWAGYAVAPSARGGSAFSNISGSWTVPAAACSAGAETYSATWVGLGGFHESSQALEQIGTDADCTRSGAAVYTAWYELVPAAPVTLKLKVHVGDQMTASVTVKGHGVTLRIRDLRTGASVTQTRRVSKLDASSAEWIVEAPSVCVGTDVCRTLTLTNFGSVGFSGLSATAGGHVGSLEDPLWSVTELELREAQHLFHGQRVAVTSTSGAAVPSALAKAGSAFAVTWSEQPAPTEQPEPSTPPGLGGGPA